MFYALNDDTVVNLNKIRDIRTVGKNSLRIIYDNDKVVLHTTNGDAGIELRYMTDDMITQVIPNTAAIFNVFGGSFIDGKEYFYHERVNFFALCINGTVNSLSNSGGYYELAKDINGFEGFYDEDMLGRYPKQEEPTEQAT